MKSFFSQFVSAVYLTDDAGVPTQVDVLDHLGRSLLTGDVVSEPVTDDPDLIQPLPDLVLDVGSEPVTIDLRQHFSGAGLSFSRSPELGALDGFYLTLSPDEPMSETLVTVTATNSGGQISDSFALTVGADRFANIDAVVVMGASLVASMFNKDLSTPHAVASDLLAAAGHNLPVYGYGTGGYRLASADADYQTVRAAHPNALILSHYGGNNTTDSRPYPGGQATFEAGLSDLEAVARGDTFFYPMAITFRDYDDTTFQNPDNGSRPYNENLLIPWIAAHFPHAVTSYGRPVFDNYRRVLQDFESWLSADNVHLTADGYTAFRQWIINRIADVLSGVEPAEITERVYVAPEEPEEPVSYPSLTVAGGTEAYTAGQFGQAMDSAGSFFARAADSLTPLTAAWGMEARIRIPTVGASEIFMGESGSAVYGVVRTGGNSPAGAACFTYAGANGSTIHLSGGPRVDDNGFHKVAVQFRSDGADLFVDGALVASSSVPISDTRPRGAGSEFTVGHYASATPYIWNGQVDEVRIWDGLELSASYTPRTRAYETLPAGTVAYWALDGNLTGGLAAPANASIGTYTIGQAGPAGSIYDGFRLVEGDDFDTVPTRFSGRNMAGRYGHSMIDQAIRRTNASQDRMLYIDPSFRGARSQSPTDLGYDGVSVANGVARLSARETPADLLPFTPTTYTGGRGITENRPGVISGSLKTSPSFQLSAQANFIVECRVRLQAGQINGYWPSFWTTTSFWPDMGEIDILEAKNYSNGTTTTLMNVIASNTDGGGVVWATTAEPTIPRARWVRLAAKRVGNTLEFWDDIAVEGTMALRASTTTRVDRLRGAHDVRLDLAISTVWDGSTWPGHAGYQAEVEFDWWRAWVPQTAARGNEPTLMLPEVLTTPGGSWAASFPSRTELYGAAAGIEQVTAAFDNADAPGMPTLSDARRLPSSMTVDLTNRTVAGTVPTTEGGAMAVFLKYAYNDGSPVRRVMLPYAVAPAVQSLPSGWSVAAAGNPVDITIPFTAFHSGNLGPHTYTVTAPGLTVTGNGTTEVRITGTPTETTAITIAATNIKNQTTTVTRQITVPATNPGTAAIFEDQFDTDLSKWTTRAVNSTWAFVSASSAATLNSGRLRLTCSGTGTRYPRSEAVLSGLTIGQSYTVAVAFSVTTEWGYRVMVLDAAGTSGDPATQGGPFPANRYVATDLMESRTFTFTATQATHYLQLMAGVATTGRYTEFESVVVT